MRTRLAPCVLAPLLALTACSSGSSPHSSAVRSTPQPSATTAAVPTSTVAPETTTSATSAPSASATSSSTASAAATASAAPVTTVAPGKPAAKRATAPGVYTLDSSGTLKYGTTTQDAKGTQTLTVSALKGDAQHSTLHGDQGDTDEDLLVRDTGTYIASLKITSPAFNGGKEFRPSPAVLLLPDPATVGKTWSWGGTSTDGKTKVTTTNKVARTESVTIGGKAVPCVVVMTHLVLSGDVAYDAQVTTWYAPAFPLPVKDHTVGSGTVSGLGIMFKTDISTLMRSVTPA